MIENVKNNDRDLFLHYNKKKYRDLLKDSQFLEKQGKSLFDESPDKFFQLLKYSAVLDSQVTWEMRNEYLELFDQLIKKEITHDDFYDGLFENLRSKRIEVFDFLESKLVLLSPDEKALGFADIIEEVFDYFETRHEDEGPDSLIEPDYNLLEKEFYDLMEKFYFKIQEYVNKEL